MSGTLQINLQITETFGTRKRVVVPAGVRTIAVAANLKSEGVISVATTAGGEAVPVSEVVANGVLYLRNLSDTYTVRFGPYVGGTLHPWGELLPGEEWPVRLQSTTVPRLIAITGAAEVEYQLWSL